MRKFLAPLAAVVTALSFTSCAAGPHQLMRTVDDWDQKTYINSPWLNAAMWVVPVIPLLHFGAGVGDFFVGDAYHFWFKDAWDMKGTGFKHADQVPTDGQVGSLIGDGSFLKVMD
ncbi:MAG: hypothetical protein KDC98_07455 [Planctomycetes bacterium]|nr:hypothetical protein [Planctomycetota bacterium]